jgi:4-aminobutyrate aminotransferase/(S)-3-amino-2-methylpropionate transaminase
VLVSVLWVQVGSCRVKSGGLGEMLSCRGTTSLLWVTAQLDIPSFRQWPAAPFPKLKYPLQEYKAENAAEEARCLAQLDSILASHPVPVAAVIVEPVQGGALASC